MYNLLFVKPEPVQCTVAVYWMQYSTEFSSMDNKVLAARLEWGETRDWEKNQRYISIYYAKYEWRDCDKGKIALE